ncbi:MAG: site-2 protease family protein [Acidimicrobiales bacterium]
MAVQPWFWVTAVLLGLGSRSLLAFVLWPPVLFIAILLHEMGHALAFRRFGSSAAIELHGLGGVTMGRVDRASHDMAVSLAGPFAGFALGVPLWFLTRDVVLFDPSLPVQAAWIAVQLFIWISVFWGLFNVLPMLPVDGGHALDAGLAWWRGHVMTRTTQVVSIITGGAEVLFSLYAWLVLGWAFVTWIMLLAALSLWANISAYRRYRSTARTYGEAINELAGNFGGITGGGGGMAPADDDDIVDLDRERKRRRKTRSVKDDIADALSALERHDRDAAMRAIHAARRQKPGGRTETLLVEIEAWACLAGREADDAARLAEQLPRRHPAKPFLDAGILIVRGDRDGGAEALAQALLAGPDDHSRVLAIELAASEGLTEEVARHLLEQGSGGFEETLRFQQGLKGLGKTAHAAIVDDVILGGA